MFRRRSKATTPRRSVHAAALHTRVQYVQRALVQPTESAVISFRHQLLGIGSRRLAALCAAVIAVIAMASIGFVAHQPVNLHVATDHEYDKPVTISFSRAVQGELTYGWKEKVDGTWREQRGWGGITALEFTPKGVLPPGATLHAQIAGMQPVLDVASSTPDRHVVEVSIQKAPGLRRTVPAQKAVDVRVDTALTLQLSAPNRKLRSLELRGDIPVLSRAPSSQDDTVFRWALAAPLEQGKLYSAQIVDRNQPTNAQHFATLQFTTVKEPQSQTDTSKRIHPGDEIVIDFDVPMQQTADVVQFALPGTGNWSSETRYTFKVGEVKPAQTYTYVVRKDAKSKAGGFVTADRKYEVRTPGSVTVVGAQPTGSRIGLTAPIRLTFDQPVDKASAQAAFRVSPSVDGSFSWSGNTMTFTPKGYGYQTTYTYGVSAGISPVFGLPGTQYSNSFLSAYEVRKLNVPYYKQIYTLSCEAASLRMALAYHGIHSNDDEILSRIGYAPQPRDTVNNFWQDPNVEFVGEVNGRLGVTGWGVYADPVAKAARSFGRSADVIRSPSTASVASAIYAGQPVVVWGVMGMSAVPDSWNTATSGVVQAARNQHVRVAYGVEGSAQNPVGFYLHDPIRGSVYITAGALQASMNGGGRQILVVR